MPTRRQRPARQHQPSYAKLREALTTIAHLRCDGDLFFGKDDGEDISNDLLQDQLTEALTIARETLGIATSGPTRPPTKVHVST